MAHKSHPQPKTAVERKREEVERWLIDGDWSVQSLPPEPGTSWGILANNPQTNIFVFQPSQRNDQWYVQGNINVSQRYRDCVKGMPAQERADFIWALLLDLLRMDVDFEGIDETLNVPCVRDTIYSDGLTKDRLLQSISKVNRGVLMILWTLARHCSESPPKEAENSTAVH